MTSLIDTIVDDVTSGRMTALQQVDQALERAAANEQYNALLSLTADQARERAAEIDVKVAAGEDAGPLAGVPFVAKDNFLAYGAPTTAAAKMLEGFNAPIQATAVERLEAAGAICIGKANLDAFAHGGSTENSAYGPTLNANDTSRVAGGSSGGSAVVTALDIVPFALGTDTGGSIRQPASFNGVYGMKPTYGAVSRYGVVAMASSTDTIGCFARSADDTRTVMRVMAGQDERDMTTISDVYGSDVNAGSLKIGVIRDTMNDDLDGEVRNVTQAMIDQLRQMGHTVEEVDLPMLKSSLAIYYIVVPAEISSNLARYDGIRYGRAAEGATTLAELYGRTRDEGFVTENKRRIMIGSYVLSSGFFDAYYTQAQKARTLLINEFDGLFQQYDVLISPTAPTPAFGLGDNTNDPIQMYLADVMTVPASLAGLPALSVPAGVSESGLPIGVQLIGAQRGDELLLELARTLEEATNE